AVHSRPGRIYSRPDAYAAKPCCDMVRLDDRIGGPAGRDVVPPGTHRGTLAGLATTASFGNAYPGRELEDLPGERVDHPFLVRESDLYQPRIAYRKRAGGD